MTHSCKVLDSPHVKQFAKNCTYFGNIQLQSSQINMPGKLLLIKSGEIRCGKNPYSSVSWCWLLSKFVSKLGQSPF